MMKALRFFALAASVVASLTMLAHAQSNPGFVTGQVPTAVQWNSYFSAKLDYNPAAPYLNACTSTTSGLVPTPPHDPTQVLNGNCAWATVAGTGNVSATGSSAVVGTLPIWTGNYTLNPLGVPFGATGNSTLVETTAGGLITNSLIASLPLANLGTVPTTTILCNPSGISASPTFCTLGANLSFSGSSINAVGGVSGPGSSTTGFVPVWGNTFGTLLGAGLPVGQVGVNTIIETNGSGFINNLNLSGIPSSALSSTISAGSCTSCNLTYDVSGRITVAGNGSGGGGAFSSLTSGTNTVAAMLVGSGASLGATGSGTIAATSMPATGLTGTLQAANFPALTGDVTTVGGSLGTVLATVNGNVGSFTNASITVNAKGLITAASNGVAPSFSALSTGTNTTAAMTVGSGASLLASGSGSIAATSVPFSGVTSTPTTLAGYGITNGATNGANSNITSLSGLTTPLSVAQGGTGFATLSVGTVPMGAGTSPLVASEIVDTGSAGVTVGSPAGGQKGAGSINMSACFINNVPCAAGSSTAFGTITSGTNTVAAMLVGTGASLSATGSGAINATAMPFSGLTGTPTTLAGYGITNGATNGANSNITSLTGLTTPLSVAQGGSGLATLTAGTLYMGAGTSALVASEITDVGSAGVVIGSPTGGAKGAGTLNMAGCFINNVACGSGGSSAFSALTGGTNTAATMIVGTGASLSASGSGSITATAMPATGLTGTLAAAQFPSLTGDVTTTGGTLATVLATVNSNIGSFTNASITVNGKGLITAASSGSGTLGFNNITSGTNTAAAMLVGTGASLGPTGTGTVTATNVPSALGTGSVCSAAGVLSVPSSCAIVPTVISTSSVALVAANAGQLVLATNVSPTTFTLAQSTGALGTGFGIDLFTEGSSSTGTVTTSKLNNQTTIKMGAYQDMAIAADGAGNYVGAASLPWPSSQGGTTFVRDDMAWTSTLLGPMTLGASGTAGSLTMGNATTGLLTLQPVTGALGTVTLSLPAVTDTLVARTTTDTLTNKTLTSPTINGGTMGAATAWTITAGTPTVYVGIDASSHMVTGPGGATTITLATPGIGNTASTYNPGTQTVTNGSSIFIQSPFYHAEASSCTVNSTCVGGSTNDSNYMLTATAASVTYTVPNPGAVGSNSYNFGYDGTHTFTLTTVGGTATFYGGCGAGATTFSGVSSPVTLITDGTNWQCFPNGGGSGSGTVTSVAFSVPASSIFTATGGTITTSGTLGFTTAVTSGGILYGSSATQVASSAVQTANALIKGGGAGVAPSPSSVTDNGTLVNMTAEPVETAQAYQPPAVLTDASTVAVNGALSNNFNLTMTSGVGATRKLANPTNLVAGQVYNFTVQQDATGGRLLTFDTDYTATIFLNSGAAAKTIFSCLADTVSTLQCAGGAGAGAPVAFSWTNQNLSAATAGIGIFTANNARSITAVSCRVETAVGGTATLDVWIAPSGTALSGGTKVTSTSCNANGTGATNQTGLITSAVSVPLGDEVGVIATGAGWATAATATGGSITITAQ